MPQFSFSRSTGTTTGMPNQSTLPVSSQAILSFNTIASTCAYAIATTNNSSPTTVVISSSAPVTSSISPTRVSTLPNEPGLSTQPSSAFRPFTRQGGSSKASTGQIPTLSTSQSLPTSSGSSTNAIPLIPTPTYYDISDEEHSPVQSPVHHSALSDIFPQLDSGQEALLLAGAVQQ